MIHELEVHFFVTGWRFPYDFEKFIFTQAFCFFVKRKKPLGKIPQVHEEYHTCIDGLLVG